MHTHTAFCITFVIFHTLCAVPPDPSYLLLAFLPKSKIKFQTVGLSELLCTICFCSSSFLFFLLLFLFYLFSVKVQARTARSLLSGLCGELVDISACVKFIFRVAIANPQQKPMVATPLPAPYLHHLSLLISS